MHGTHIKEGEQIIITNYVLHNYGSLTSIIGKMLESIKGSICDHLEKYRYWSCLTYVYYYTEKCMRYYIMMKIMIQQILTSVMPLTGYLIKLVILSQSKAHDIDGKVWN